MDGKLLIDYMRSLDMRVRAINIVYLEDADADTWNPLPEQPNIFNDVRILVTDKGEVLLSCLATTEPGAHYTYSRMNEKGAARIKLNTQFKDAWEIGYHYKQLALVQRDDITVCRDDNEDFRRTNDKLDTGLFGINQHTTGDDSDDYPPPRKNIKLWSAGCLVGWHPKTHYTKFMPILKSSGMKKFDTVVFDAGKFASFLQIK